MFSTVLMYEIETVQKGVWKLRDTILPNYGYTNYLEKKRFLWWTWIVNHRTIDNERKARIRARRKAFRKAKRLYPEYNVRVFIVFKFPEVNDPIRHCIWENGHYYSTH